MTTILKFGGSSVATADGMRNVASIVRKRAQNEQIIMVISALRGVTDQLIETVNLAGQENVKYKDVYRQIVSRHRELVDSLFESGNIQEISKKVDSLLRGIHKLLYSIRFLHDNNLNIFDLVNSFGEQLSAIIFSAYLNTLTPARYVDARQIILTDNNFSKANILFKESAQLTQDFFENFYEQEGDMTVPVVTGFIGITKDKHTTTIGRDGSNYTAAFLGAALSAKKVEIWSDVNGVYSADPKLISNSIVIPYLDYIEAEELSRLHVKIIRQAIIPELQKNNIPVCVKNSFNPDAKGTQISLHTNRRVIKNITIKHSFHLITLSRQKSSSLDLKKITERLYRIFNHAGINFSFITQPNSSNDVSFLLFEEDVIKAKQVIDIEFIYEFQNKFLTFKQSGNQSIIALVGREIRQTSSHFGNILIALEKNHLKLNGILYGAPECNISLVINSNHSKSALAVIHETISQWFLYE